MSLANKPQAIKVVSKKFGDVKKISLFERSEFEIFSRRAFCVLLGRAPARSLKVLGVARRGKDQSKGPNPLRKGNSKALLYKNFLNIKSLYRNLKASALKKFYSTGTTLNSFETLFKTSHPSSVINTKSSILTPIPSSSK